MRKSFAVIVLFLVCAAALLAFDQAAAMRSGFDLRASVAELIGAVRVRDVDAGAPSLQSDRLVFSLTGVQAPPAGFSAQAYLADKENGFFCGELPVVSGAVNTLLDFPGENLVADYDSLRILWEREVFAAALPAEALALIREVVARAESTPNKTGYGVGLVQEARMMLTHANLARSSAAAGQLAGARVHTEHVLNILYGKDDSRHRDYNGDGKVENPGDGFGLL
ncbi:MAG: hypothetical protein R6W76_08335, partial [Caldilinea sp.]